MKYKMKVEFSWYFNEKTNNIEPMLNTDFIDDYNVYVKNKIRYFFDKNFNEKELEYKGLIVDLFTEYAWEKYENIKYEIKKYIEISINEVKMVLDGKRKEYFFDSMESWSSNITKEGVLIFFNFNENYFDIIPTNCFYEILVKWKEFLDTVPNLNKKVNIQCEGN